MSEGASRTGRPALRTVAWAAGRAVLRVLGSFRLAVLLIVLLLVLTWFGTMAQATRTIYDVQREYFESAFVVVRLGSMPLLLPGAYLLLSVLLVNLVVGGILRMRKRKATLGVLIAHLGIVLLLVGSYVEHSASDKGFVRLVDYMGGDHSIVQSARVSYGSGTKSVREDKGLINYLLRNWHTSPFEQVQMTFHCKMPIFVARQWVRHRTARLNEVSGRYSIMTDEFYVPDEARVQFQSLDNKQGSGDSMPADYAKRMVDEIGGDQKQLYSHYEEMVEQGMARELARINLPLSLYTEWYWQIDLHNLFHFLRLRLDPHAQYEIRVYAEAMAECARAVRRLDKGVLT